MKQIKKIAIAIVFLVGATGFVNAQAKIAHIDVQKLISDMPEFKAADAELKKLQETYMADIQSSVTELRNKITQYENESASKSEEENRKRALEVQGFERNIGEAQQTASQELQKKQMELMGPITEKARKAIESVAASQGLDYVMDASQGSGLIVAKGKDILPEVKKQLGF